jgi:hypothetical protein
MPMTQHALESELRAAFPDADIRIEDLAGDGDHYRARIVSETFAGLPRAPRPGPGNPDAGPGGMTPRLDLARIGA